MNYYLFAWSDCTTAPIAGWHSFLEICGTIEEAREIKKRDWPEYERYQIIEIANLTVVEEQ